MKKSIILVMLLFSVFCYAANAETPAQDKALAKNMCDTAVASAQGTVYKPIKSFSKVGPIYKGTQTYYCEVKANKSGKIVVILFQMISTGQIINYGSVKTYGWLPPVKKVLPKA